MRKVIIIVVVLVAVIFGTGYVISQVRGVTASSASNPPSGTSAGNGRSFGGFGGFRGGASSGPRAFGQVTGVSGDTITISPTASRFGSSTYSTIDVSSTTQYSVGFGQSGSLSDVKNGAYVMASGTAGSDGSMLDATSVRILSASGGFGGGPGGFGGGGFGGGFGGGTRGSVIGPRAAGKVTAVNGNTVAIAPIALGGSTSSSTTTVQLTSSTTYVAGFRGGTAAQKSDVKTGVTIVAQGTLGGNGKTLTATRVTVLSGTFAPPGSTARATPGTTAGTNA